MNHLQLFRAIEANTHLQDLKFNGYQLWSIVRNKYRHHLLANISDSQAGSKRSMALVKNIFYGFSSLFRRYDTVLFSHTINRKLLNGTYYDRFTDPISDCIGQNNACTVELTNDSHHKRDTMHTKHVVSHIGIKIVGLLLSKFIKVPDIADFNAINTQFNIRVNYQKDIKEFIANTAVFMALLKLWRPKQIYVVCYYSYIDVIFAAHKLGIPVIEIQHGLIGDKHLAYHSSLALNKEYFPDTLFTFGQFDADALSASTLFKHTERIPLGNWLLEYATHKVDAEQKKLLRKQLLIKPYKKIIVITSQVTVENQLIAFVKQTAKLSHDNLFIFLPRTYNEGYSTMFHDYENIILTKEYDFYTLVQVADVHATVYSTCALEATRFDVINVLININDMSVKHFQNILQDKKDAYFIATPEEMIQCITKEKRIAKEMNSYFFAHDYNHNLKKRLGTI